MQQSSQQTPSGGSGRSGSGRPAGGRSASRPGPTEAELAKANRWLQAALLLTLCTYLAAALNLPWKAAAVPLGAAGVVVGVMALAHAVRARLPLLLRLAAASAVAAAALFGLAALGQVLFWQQTAELEQCRSLALTQRSADRCVQDYTRKITEVGNSMRGPGG